MSRSAALFCVALAACGGEAPPELGRAAQPIMGGYDYPGDSAIVSVLHKPSATLCTGTLIAPNTVLTARHCVSELAGASTFCADLQVAQLHAPADFYIATRDTLDTELNEYPAVDVIPLPGSDPFLCGRDMAAIILAQNAPVTPYVPRIDTPMSPGETYSAVGFGATSEAGGGLGDRRRRDDLTASCLGAECANSEVDADEWFGTGGVCIGDSGGPAIDGSGQLVGVSSRGPGDCSSTVMGSMVVWSEWLKDTVVNAATAGGYDPPAWAGGPVVTPPPGDDDDGGGSSAEEGCAIQSPAEPATSWWLLALAAAAVALLRRAQHRRR